MATFNEDSSNAHNPIPDATLTSEVGSGQLQELEGQVADMRELNQTLMQRPSTESIKLALPSFDPEGVGSDPSAWCSYTDMILKKYPIQDSALLSAVNRALKGSAAHWFLQIVRSGKFTWPTFKEEFLSRFGRKETAASALIKISREPPSETESLGAYGSRIRSMIQTRLGNLTTPELLNAFTLYMLSSRDQRFLRLTRANNIKTEDQFYDEMNLLPDDDPPTPTPGNLPTGLEVKRRRSSDYRGKCYRCGNIGHKATEY